MSHSELVYDVQYHALGRMAREFTELFDHLPPTPAGKIQAAPSPGSGLALV